MFIYFIVSFFTFDCHCTLDGGCCEEGGTGGERRRTFASVHAFPTPGYVTFLQGLFVLFIITANISVN